MNHLRRFGRAVERAVKPLNLDALVQVGVGRGHELRWLKSAQPLIPFFAFEPGEDLYGENYPGTLYRLAIGDQIGYRDLYFVHRRPSETASMIPHVGKRGTYRRVPTITLDAYSSEFAHNRVLLWLDAEGSELAALRGGREFIRDRVRYIVCELTPAARLQSRPGWPSEVDILDELRAHGFGLQQVLSTGDAGYDALFERKSTDGH